MLYALSNIYVVEIELEPLKKLVKYFSKFLSALTY